MKLHETIDREEISGSLVGLEIEVEGGVPVISNKHINTVPDGSLRNGGVEYVYSSPVTAEESNEIIGDINKYLQDNEVEPVFSFRTSVHVHLNCSDLTLPELRKILITMFLLEPLLIKYSGKGRKGNRFCLGLCDAEMNVANLDVFFRAKTYQEVWKLRRDGRLLTPGSSKYSAINIVPLLYQGSIEVRTMRGTLDQEVLDKWVKAITNIREKALSYPSDVWIFEKTINEGIRWLSEDVFDEDCRHFFNEFQDQQLVLDQVKALLALSI